jgi:hypothetical protein
MYKKITFCLSLFISLLLLSATAQKKPVNTDFCTHKITVVNGPEDLSIDTVTSPAKPRIITACNTRREGEPHYGEVYSYEIHTARTTRMARLHEPSDICFNPHGIDLVKVGDSLILLAVNHCREIKVNSIIRYLVKGDSLYFLQKITDPLFVSPNALAGFPDGSFLVSNDAGKRGNIWEMLFKQKKSKVIYCKNGQCNIAADKVCFGNGLLIQGDTVYQASTLPGELYRYTFKDGKLLNRIRLAKVKGADNIRLHGNELTVAGHLKFGMFLSHMKHKEKPSPSAIYTINKYTGATILIYYNDGKVISASSTGLIFRHKLYIAEVFDDYILEVDMGCHQTAPAK